MAATTRGGCTQRTPCAVAPHTMRRDPTHPASVPTPATPFVYPRPPGPPTTHHGTPTITVLGQQPLTERGGPCVGRGGYTRGVVGVGTPSKSVAHGSSLRVPTLGTTALLFRRLFAVSPLRSSFHRPSLHTTCPLSYYRRVHRICARRKPHLRSEHIDTRPTLWYTIRMVEAIPSQPGTTTLFRSLSHEQPEADRS